MNPESPSIAFFTPSLGEGGSQRVIRNLAVGFAEREYDVDLLVLSADGPYAEALPEHVRVVELRADRTLFAVPELVRYLRNDEPDVLLSTMEHVNVATLMAGAVSRGSTAIAVRITNPRSVESRSGISDRLQYALARLLYPKAGAVLSLSESVREDASTHYRIDEANIHAIYNPLLIEEIRRRADEPVTLPCADSSDLIVNVSSLSEQKDVGTTVRAFARLVEDRDAELLLLGEGDKRAAVEATARDLGVFDRVYMPGFVDNPYAYVAAADVFVLSSLWDGLPNAVLESLACGTPVVATDSPGGVSEILADGAYGSLVPVGNHQALAAATAEMLDDPVPADVLRRRAMDFDYRSITDEYERVLFEEG